MSAFRLTIILAGFAGACAAFGQPGATDRATGPSPVRIRFVTEADSLAPAAREYERLWADEGARMVAAMESVSGLRFDGSIYADTSITALVVERASSSGYRERPMEMRASYPPDTKRATLIHELGHRLQSNLFRQGEQEHGPLFLWIYDVWSLLYGPAFADAQVEVERRRRGPYPAAWDSAMALTAEQRAARWRAIRDERSARSR
jgi:hypothetical protein